MGGGGGSDGGSDMKDDLCFICDQAFHGIDDCSWLYNMCKKPNCNGIIQFYVSKLIENPGRKYLKCQFPTCGTFQWLCDVIGQSSNLPSMSSPSFKGGCYGYEEMGTGGENVHGGL
ncbi:hypothetical protein GIB67_040951 [Kingdonia uniflora]|uniref:Uncharacterized protein n=1 Tax=Kingdonia uniflora TaxID=39325 RepID=A0A7J7M6A1_9MAGN|nr:hypothetical protein GIB67_040951 [Kingdonia uniflora]